MTVPSTEQAMRLERTAVATAPPSVAATGGAQRVTDGRIVNAMSVDVEDYFQVQAFARTIDRGNWAALPSRVERNTDAVMALFDQAGVKATFFTLGWVAERHPALVRRIAAAGHEIASHGWSHVRVDDQTADAFRADIRRTKRLLEDTAGQPVRGYRAASFSMGPKTPWAHDVLAEEGHAYSSSIYPVKHDIYGDPDAPRFAYRPKQGLPIVEFPVTTTRFLGRSWPCGGGGYFRLLPYGLMRAAMRRVNRIDGQGCIFYFHPWEIDPGQPRQTGIGLKTRVRHYTNLGAMEGRLRRVLRAFAWDRMDVAFANQIGTAR
jgi:peptidoglycan-N-acetylglucosamine deacetylase